MKSIFKWIIAFVVLGGIVAGMIFQELDYEQFFKWEFILVGIMGVTVLLLMKWRRSMRIEDTEVCIQFLDD